MKKTLISLLALASFLVFSGCARVGKDFDLATVNKVQNGKTTRSEIEQLFGAPFKTGIQNGDPMWTYEYNEYHSLGQDFSKDLIVVFDNRGVVKSHQLMSNRPIP